MGKILIKCKQACEFPDSYHNSVFSEKKNVKICVEMMLELGSWYRDRRKVQIWHIYLLQSISLVLWTAFNGDLVDEEIKLSFKNILYYVPVL